jgi:hypothetical protein
MDVTSSQLLALRHEVQKLYADSPAFAARRSHSLQASERRACDPRGRPFRGAARRGLAARRRRPRLAVDGRDRRAQLRVNATPGTRVLLGGPPLVEAARGHAEEPARRSDAERWVLGLHRLDEREGPCRRGSTFSWAKKAAARESRSRSILRTRFSRRSRSSSSARPWSVPGVRRPRPSRRPSSSADTTRRSSDPEPAARQGAFGCRHHRAPGRAQQHDAGAPARCGGGSSDSFPRPQPQTVGVRETGGTPLADGRSPGVSGPVVWATTTPLRVSHAAAPGFSTEAVQAPARVKVTCVTPLGEEVASIS